MNNRRLIAFVGVMLSAGSLAALADDPAPKPPGPASADSISWKKTVIEKAFRSEGVAVADVNRDGKLDVLVGDLWYEAPDWTKHPIRQVGDYGDGSKGYSECMCCWADDVNGDGWVDQISIGFPGKPAFWYENPQGKDGPWTERVAWPSACNETPLYVDLFGTGKRVLVMGFQPSGQDNKGRMAWFSPSADSTQPWAMHPISEPSTDKNVVPGTNRFSHGLGVGDLNTDGRLDVICTGGWWEQPEGAKDASTPWTFHKANLGEACADMIAYDLDPDHWPDVVSSSAHKYGIWSHRQVREGSGEPTFERQTLFPDLVSETHALIARDINTDGLPDLVTGKRFLSHGRSEPGSDKAAILYWLEARKGSDGKIAFTPREIDNDSGIGTQFVVRDYDGDGLLDVIVSNKKGVYLLEQKRESKTK